jgi:hypothetical protein
MSLLRVIPFAAAATVLVLVACSSSSDGGGTSGADAAAGTDSSSSTDGSSSADTSTATDSSTTDTSTTACTAFPDAGASCNAIVQGGTDKTPTAHVAALPDGTGGTIADGRYYLTGFDTYTGSALGGVTLKQTLELCGGVGQFVNDEPGKPTRHKSFTFAPAGNAPNVTTTCSTEVPDTNIPYSSYTATPTTVTFYSTVFAFSVTYTKQ